MQRPDPSPDRSSAIAFVAFAAAATLNLVAVLNPATPFLLGGYVLLRVILGRLRGAEDNHYDGIEP